MENNKTFILVILGLVALTSCQKDETCEGCERWEIVSNNSDHTGSMVANVETYEGINLETIYYQGNEEFESLEFGDVVYHHKHIDNFCGVVVRLGEDWVLVRNESNLNEKSFHGIPKEVMNEIVMWDRFCGSVQW